jgi:hypothetical protein
VVVVDDEGTPTDRPVDKFRRSAAGAVVSAGLLGLRDALEGRPEREEAAIVNEAPEVEPDDLDVQIDFEHPGETVVVVHVPRES